MTSNEMNLPPVDSEQEESLSATGMFRRAFEPKKDSTKQEAREDSSTPEFTGTTAAAQGTGPSADSSALCEKGEFTRLFQSAQPASDPPSGRGSTSAPPIGGPPVRTSSPDAPGEFTRIFLNRSAGRGPDSVRPAADGGNPAPARGYSAHGASESTAAEGSVTQLFRAPSAPLARAAAAASGISASAPPQPSGVQAKEREPFHAPEAVPAPAKPRITNLLQSLSSADGYAGQPIGSGPALSPSAVPQAGSGGVTQFIQKLAEEPRISAAAPPPAVPVPIESVPGEYTRMVARPDERPDAFVAAGTSALSMPPQNPSAQPAIPAAPMLSSMPAVTAAPLPQPSAPPPAAALPLGKSRLEAMAPALLALNTILLLAVFLLLILLLRSR